MQDRGESQKGTQIKSNQAIILDFVTDMAAVPLQLLYNMFIQY